MRMWGYSLQLTLKFRELTIALSWSLNHQCYKDKSSPHPHPAPCDVALLGCLVDTFWFAESPCLSKESILLSKHLTWGAWVSTQCDRCCPCPAGDVSEDWWTPGIKMPRRGQTAWVWAPVFSSHFLVALREVCWIQFFTRASVYTRVQGADVFTCSASE